MRSVRSSSKVCPGSLSSCSSFHVSSVVGIRLLADIIVSAPFVVLSWWVSPINYSLLSTFVQRELVSTRELNAVNPCVIYNAYKINLPGEKYLGEQKPTKKPEIRDS